MLDVSELFTKAQSRAQKFIGRSDLPALAQIAAGSYLRARERTSRLTASLNANNGQKSALAHELEAAEEVFKQSLIEYAAVLRALGDSEAATRICHGVDIQTTSLCRQSMAPPYGLAQIKIHSLEG